ncbi:MAG: prephenate dehydrogenase [Leptospiraceae bacterium]|nr:prephenate dehydrogenase [Leptospiraceae bacterium]
MTGDRAHNEFPFHNILILGMGMMGASLAMALRAVPGFNGHIHGVVRSARSVETIAGYGLADEIFQCRVPEEIDRLDVSGYDLIVLGVPPHSIIEMLPRFPEFKGVISDMSSTRREVHQAFAARPDLNFVGSHPMCGSENQGPAHGFADLFHNHLCLLLTDVGERKVHVDSLERVQEFWERLQMRTFRLTVSQHDEILAYLSHGPHVLSSLLALWADAHKLSNVSTHSAPLPITGGGFKGMSRIAGSNPEMWTDIMFTNADNILHALKQFRDMLDEVILDFERRDRADWTNWFRRARQARNHLCGIEEEL